MASSLNETIDDFFSGTVFLIYSAATTTVRIARSMKRGLPLTIRYLRAKDRPQIRPYAFAFIGLFVYVCLVVYGRTRLGFAGPSVDRPGDLVGAFSGVELTTIVVVAFAGMIFIDLMTRCAAHLIGETRLSTQIAQWSLIYLYGVFLFALALLFLFACVFSGSRLSPMGFWRGFLFDIQRALAMGLDAFAFGFGGWDGALALAVIATLVALGVGSLIGFSRVRLVRHKPGSYRPRLIVVGTLCVCLVAGTITGIPPMFVATYTPERPDIEIRNVACEMARDRSGYMYVNVILVNNTKAAALVDRRWLKAALVRTSDVSDDTQRAQNVPRIEYAELHPRPRGGASEPAGTTFRLIEAGRLAEFDLAAKIPVEHPDLAKQFEVADSTRHRLHLSSANCWVMLFPEGAEKIGLERSAPGPRSQLPTYAGAIPFVGPVLPPAK